MRSKDFSFSFTKYVSEFIILRKNIEEVRSRIQVYKVYRACLNFQEIMLDHSEVDIEVLNNNIKTMEFGKYRKSS